VPGISGVERAGLRIAAIASEIAESYARIQGQDRPPLPNAASWA
jgi:hypothetical protein